MMFFDDWWKVFKTPLLQKKKLVTPQQKPMKRAHSSSTAPELGTIYLIAADVDKHKSTANLCY